MTIEQIVRANAILDQVSNLNDKIKTFKHSPEEPGYTFHLKIVRGSTERILSSSTNLPAGLKLKIADEIKACMERIVYEFDFEIKKLTNELELL